MANESDILRDAIIGTEKEIFGDAFGADDLTLDETGDRSLEAMGEGLEGQVEDEPEAGEEEAGEHPEASATEEMGENGKEGEQVAGATAEATIEPQQRDQHGRVPPGRLRQESDARRLAETERDRFRDELEAERKASQKAISDLSAKFEGVLAALQRQPAAAQPKPDEAPHPETVPDLFENPTAFVEHLNKGFQSEIATLKQQMHQDRVNASMEVARQRHGETFDAAFNALKGLDFKNPDNAALLQRLDRAPNAGEALVTWHRRNEALRRVGDDPAAYEARVAEEARQKLMADPEFRKQLLADLRGEAMVGDNGRPRTETRLPKSLNRAPGGNMRAPNDLEIFDGSDRATFDSAWT